MIGFILGTNAELIKTMPVMKELENRGIGYYFIHTGQHRIDGLVKDFGIKKPDKVLYAPPELSSRFMVKTHKAIFWDMPLVFKIQRSLRKIKNLDYVFYHGDTMSAATGAMGSSEFLNFGKKWKNAHLESGLRSGDLFEPFPEEIARRICDRFSDILFAVSKGSVKNLKEEHVKGKIVNVGNTIIDAAYISHKLADKKFGKLKEKNYCLINIHRHENITSKKRLEKIVEIIENVDIKAYWPLHDNTKQQLVKFGLMKRIQKKDDIEVSRLISYLEFIQKLANCKYLITDGGSIQEESLAFKKLCILLREKTERDEGLESGINFLTKLNVQYSKKLIENIERGRIKVKKFTNPYGDGTAAKKIVDLVESGV